MKKKNFTPEQRRKFNRVKKAGIDGIVVFGAMWMIGEEEAALVRQESPDRIIPSRFVLTQKRGEYGEETREKARWCALGKHDQEAYHVKRFSPTPATSTLMLVLVIMALQNFTMVLADFKMTFMQTDAHHRRGGKLYAKLPPGGVDGYPDGAILELMEAVYGLDDGPVVWRETLRRYLLELGYKESSFDPCYYKLVANNEDRRELGLGKCGVVGILLADVDDLLQRGGSRHKELVNVLRGKLVFGKLR